MTRMLLFVSLACVSVTSASAYKRARLPDAVAVAQADVIGVATVTEVQDPQRWLSKVRVRVDRTLMGTLTGGHDVTLEGHDWKVGDKVLVHLIHQGGDWVALLNGTERYSAGVEAERVTQIKARPPWPDPVDGWSSVLVLESATVAPGDHLNAWIVYRNQAQTPRPFTYLEWPPERHTRWTLHVDRGGQPVAAVAHPHVTPADIEGYFSQHGSTFEVALQPGETFALPIPRINSAEPGWGYKQRLGFRYWPMSTPGSYSIWAEDHNFAGRAAVRTPPVTVVVAP